MAEKKTTTKKKEEEQGITLANLDEEQEVLKQANEIRQRKVQERVEACKQEMEQVFQKYNCTLEVAMIVTVEGARPIVSIVPVQNRQ